MLLYSRYWREYLPFWHPGVVVAAGGPTTDVLSCADPKAARERMTATVGSCILATWSEAGWECVR
jgi:hypothetical protein